MSEEEWPALSVFNSALRNGRWERKDIYVFLVLGERRGFIYFEDRWTGGVWKLEAGVGVGRCEVNYGVYGFIY
jgi:hypothetical protein